MGTSGKSRSEVIFVKGKLELETGLINVKCFETHVSVKLADAVQYKAKAVGRNSEEDSLDSLRQPSSLEGQIRRHIYV